MGKLVGNGLVASFKGNRGGYELARPAEEITMLDVISAVEGPYQLSRCLQECGECNRGASGICAFQQVFRRISEQVNQELAAVNFAGIVEQSCKKQ